MGQSTAKKRTRFCQVALFAATMAPAVRILADNIDWNATSGDWFNSANWTDATSQLSKVPTSSDDAFIQDNGTVNLNSNVAMANSVTIGSSSFNGGTLLINGGLLFTGTISLQDGGYLSFISGGFNYSAVNQTGGVFADSAEESDDVYTQSGGSHTVGGQFILGSAQGFSGTYNLSGTGSFTANNDEVIGAGGAGTFIQSGGINSTTSPFSLAVNAGSTGTYNLSGTGSLSASSSESVGGSGAGTFLESGGVNSAGALLLGVFSGSAGTYNLSATGSLSVGTTEYIGYYGAGTFIQSGGNNTVASTGTALVVGEEMGSVGTYLLSDGALSVSNANNGPIAELVGAAGAGVFLQTGGTNTATSLVVCDGSGSGSYTLRAGTLTVTGNEDAGKVGNGTFIQSGGTNTVDGNLYIGTNLGGNGNFTLSGGTLTVGGNELVGDSGTGNFTQSGGANSITGTINIAAISGSSGTYNLQGGVVTAGAIMINPGGTFTQNGGSFSTGSVNMIGGVLTQTAGSSSFGSGTVGTAATATVSGGTMAVNGTVVANGTLNLSNSAVTGSGTLAGNHIFLNGGVSGAATIRLDPAASTGSTSLGSVENESGSNTWSGNILLNSSQDNLFSNPNLAEIGSAAGTLTITGVIGNTAAGGTWAKTGQGAVVLAGNLPNTYTRLTRVFGGQLILEKDGALGAAGSTTAADGNTFMLSSVNSSIDFLAPPTSSQGFTYSTFEWIHTSGFGFNGLGQIDNLGGNNVFAGNIGLGGATFGSVPVASIGVSADSLELTGGMDRYLDSLGPLGTVLPITINKLGAGTLILAAYSGTLTTNLDAPIASGTVLNVNAGTVILAGAPGNAADLPNVGTWTVNSGADLVVQQPYALGPGTVALNGGSLLATSGLNGTVPLSVANGSTIDVGPNSIQTTLVTGSGELTKNGAGRLITQGVQIGGLSISAGTVSVTSGRSTAKTSDLAILAVSPGAALDLGDNDLIIDYPKISPLMSTILPNLKLGFANGWTGAGITSSAAAAVAADSSNLHKTALGYAEASALGITSFDGLPVDSTAILIRYTYVGDSNLDGTVNALDFNALATAYGQHAGSNLWDQGDFNYDGTVDSSDFAEMAANYGQVLATSSDLPDAEFGVVVPEPIAAGLFVIASMSLLSRRRAYGSPLAKHF